MRLLTSGRNELQNVHLEPRDPDEYKILFKFFPNLRDRNDEFLIALMDCQDVSWSCWVPVGRFSDMEVGDVLRDSHAQQCQENWLELSDECQVRRLYVPLDEEIDVLGFVSLPVCIGDEAYYVSRRPSRWIVISYSVAREYFGRAEFVTSQVDHYRALGVTQDASSEWIRSSYRRLARIYHPDRAPAGMERDYANRMCVLNEAYETLKDARRRAEYDHRGNMPTTLKLWPGGGPGKLTALIEKRGLWWIVRKILRFQKLTLETSFSVLIHEIVFGNGEVHIPMSSLSSSAYLNIESTVFFAHPEMNNIKDEIDGIVTVTLEDVQRADWNEEKDEAVCHWVTENVRLSWPDGAIERLEQWIGEYVDIVS